MKQSSEILTSSLISVIDNLNKPFLSKNYRHIRPDITSANVISLKSSGFAGPVVAIEEGEILNLSHVIHEKSIKPAQVDTLSSDFPASSNFLVNESIDYSDVDDYFTSDVELSELFNEAEAESEGFPSIPAEPKKIESFQYGELDEKVLYLDPDNPKILSTRGKMEIWRELNTLRS